MQDYRTFIGWQKAYELVKDVYQLSFGLPANEMYGLTSRLIRTALPIATNIAEGLARDSNFYFTRFVKTALGSASGTEYLGYARKTA